MNKKVGRHRKRTIEMWEEQNHRCYFCNCKTVLQLIDSNGYNMRLQANTATCEHLVPKADGGSNRRVNVRMSCHKCNELRGRMNSVEWFRIAHNPVTYQRWIDDREETIRVRRLEKNKKRRAKWAAKAAAHCLKKYGMCWEIVEMPMNEFKELFKTYLPQEIAA